MSDETTLVIRGGTVIDGRGGPPREADVAIRGDRIVEVGRISRNADREIDARGMLVTPGLVDVHTHYDGQATWTTRMTPSSTHGVTTVMMGNCGVGFAPCHPDRHEMLVELMQGVEDIPNAVLAEGLPWNWTTFPEYLDSLQPRAFDVDLVGQLPHAALRVHVMGERGANRDPADPEDRSAMTRIAVDALRAGAFGISTSRSISHRSADGRPTPTLGAAETELQALGSALREAGTGWLQVTTDFDDLESEFAILRRVAESSGRPVSISLLQKDARPQAWRHLLELVTAANAAGLVMHAQVSTRATGVLFGLALTEHPFFGRPSYDAIADLPLAARVAALRDPQVRSRVLAERTTDVALATRCNTWTKIFPLGDPPNYEPSADASVAAVAAREGRTPDAVALDLLLADEGRAILYRPMSNYSEGNLNAVGEMLAHPHTLVGLGDGGAHLGHLCDSSVMSFMLTYWTRGRGERRFPIEWAVKRVTRDNAVAIGLHDRGVIDVGYRADLNVMDYDRLRLRAPYVVHDLPSGGLRLLQDCEGIVTTLVAGTPVHWMGTPTGDLPGRLLRSTQTAPS